METVEFGRFGRCAKLSFEGAVVLVTTQIGPRIILFGRPDGPNMLCELGENDGLGDLGLRLYGGHRIWAGPEEPAVMYQPDNAKLDVREEAAGVRFVAPPDGRGIQVELFVRGDDGSGAIRLEHALRNVAPESQTVFPWVLTMMAAGGECLFPLPEPGSHAEALCPAAALVLWRYTNLEDPRWRLGPRICRLRQAEGAGPQKIGALVEQGYAAYSNFGDLFLKRFPCDAPAYADLGCNFETFTNAEMLEVESLGPTRTLAPGETAVHPETWYLVPNSEPPDDDADCSAWLASIARPRPL